MNGEIRQDADLSELIWSVGDIIAFCSQSVRLQAGDLIFTGTPAGVVRSDQETACLAALKVLVKFLYRSLSERQHDPTWH